MAAAEAVHGRRARERGLDHPRRSRPSTVRGWATRTRTSRAWASASSDRRTAAATIRSPGRRTRITSALASQVARAGEGDELLRRDRHAHHRAVRDAEASAPADAADAAAAPSSATSTRPCAHSRWTDPSATVPALARGLRATRAAHRQRSTATRMRFTCCGSRSSSSQEAITTALAIDFTAIAQPAGMAEPTGPAAAFAPPATMDPVVPGRRSMRRCGSRTAARPTSALDAVQRRRHRDGGGVAPGRRRRRRSRRTKAVDHVLSVSPSPDAPLLAAVLHAILDRREPLHRPRRGVAAAGRRPRRRWRSPRYTCRRRAGRVCACRSCGAKPHLPYGYVMRELAVVPAMAVNVSPRQAMVPQSPRRKSVRVQVELDQQRCRGHG